MRAGWPGQRSALSENERSEEWRAVCGFEDYYQVSSLGRVRSLDRVETISDRRHATPHERLRKGRVLKPQMHVKGYPKVELKVAGEEWQKFVHVLVCEAFHGLRPDGMEVRHLDGDSGNPRADNLQWATHAVNMRDRVRHGTSNPGERCHLSVLTEQQVMVIRGSSASYTRLAEAHGVSTCTISNIKKGRTWRHLLEDTA